MKKIGLLTLPFNNNYGGLLQSYALQTILKNRGHEVKVLFMTPELPPDSLVERFKKWAKVISGRERKRKARLREISKNMERFAETQMVRTEPIFRQSDFSLLDQYAFDAYVVGSDQVWRFDYTKSRTRNYFLDFVNNGRPIKVSFAASFGIADWTKDKSETFELSKLAREFNGVSVREKSGMELCDKFLKVQAEHILDPAMLIAPKYYENLIKSSEKCFEVPDNALLVYVLDFDEDKQRAVKIICDELSCDFFRVGVEQKNEGPFNEKMVYPSVESWLEGFFKAKFIFTDSFHGCAFSILFNKPFLVYGNKSRGLTRFQSLLEMFDLKSRFIDNSHAIDTTILHESINYGPINEILEIKREEADKFLEKSGL